MLPGEKKYLSIAIALGLLLGVVGLYTFTTILSGPSSSSLHARPLYYGYDDVWVKVYQAELDRLELKETYLYHVSKQGYHMLYRSWDSMVTVGENTSKPHIEVLSVKCPKGFIPYAVDYHQNIYTPLPDGSPEYKDLEDRLRSAGATNEAGCYNPGGIPPGDYQVSYVFRLHPPATCSTDGCVVDLSLARGGRHLNYENVSVIIMGVEDARLHITSQLAGLNISRRESSWLVQGSLPKYTSLRLILLYSNGTQGLVEVGHVHSAMEDMKGRASGERLALAGGISVAGILTVMALSIPVFTLYSYYRYGRERKSVGSIPYGFPPQTGEKPWEVAVLYGGRPGSVDWRVLSAILLSLEAKEAISRTMGPDGKLSLMIREPSGELDEAEKAVYNFLKSIAQAGIVTMDMIKQMRKSRSLRMEARSLYIKLLRLAGNLEKRAVDYPRRLKLLTIAMLFIAFALTVVGAFISVNVLTYNALGMATFIIGGINIVLLLFIMIMPSYVLGRWRQGYLERLLAWRHFKEMIGKRGLASADTSQIAPYLAALGIIRVGGELEVILKAYRTFTRTIFGPRGVGGGGGGGGFGGGGAGAR